MAHHPVRHDSNGTPASPGALEGFDVDAFMMTTPKTADSSLHQIPRSAPIHDRMAGYGEPSPAPSQSSAPPGQRPAASHKGARKTSDKQGQASDPQSQPHWTELKTKAGKDRKRLPLACIACRRKKIRCSGEKPACKHCLKSRIPCVYKVTTRKAAPRTDYMAMLDKRMKRMEERVIKIIPKDDLPKLPGIGRAVVKPSASQNAKMIAGEKRQAEEAFGADLEAWADSPAAIKPKSENKGLKASQEKQNEETSLLLEGAEHLPPPEIQQHLAEVYFDHVYGQSYLLLHKPSFMRRLENGKIAPVLLLAVCAISARFSNHPAVKTEPAFLRGDQWAEPAREIALKRFDSPNITILIVFLILGLHEFGTCRGGRSWMFGGMANRMAYALQLHKDLDHEPSSSNTGRRAELSHTDREIRRRTMWACFLMDRFNSSGTDRPMLAQEQYLQLQLPMKESLFQMEVSAPTENLLGEVTDPVERGQGQMADPKQNMGVAAFTVKIVTIWGRLLQYLNLGGKFDDTEHMWSPKSRFRELQAQIQEWHTSLPAHLTYSEENLQVHSAEGIANQYIYMHIMYYQTLLFSSRFSFPTTAIAPYPADTPREFIAEARKTAIKAAGDISLLVEDAIQHRVVAPSAGYTAYLSSAIHVYCAFQSDSKLVKQAKDHLARNIRYLSEMKRYWGMFHFMMESLKELYRSHADVAAKGASTPPSTDRKRVLQYGDWFQHYPHGVSHSDYQEPDPEIKKEGEDTVMGQKSPTQSVEEFFSTLPAAKGPRSKRAVKKNTKAAAQAAKAAGSNNSPSSAAAKRRPSGTGNAPKLSSPTSQSFNPQQQQPQHLQQQQQQQQQQAPAQSLDHMDMPYSSIYNAFPESYDRSQIYPLQHHLQHQQQSSTPQTATPTMSDLVFDQTSNPYTPTHQSLNLASNNTFGLVPQLDRQLVHASYNGVDPSSAAQGMSDPIWALDMGSVFGENYVPNVEQSTAWFMPFNLAPPDYSMPGLDTMGGSTVFAPDAGLSAISPTGGWPLQDLGGRGAGGGGGGGGDVDGDLSRINNQGGLM